MNVQLNPTLRLAGFALILGAAAACAAATPAAPEPPPTATAIQTIEIGAADYSFTIADTVLAGWSKVTLKNAGKEVHHVQLFRARRA